MIPKAIVQLVALALVALLWPLNVAASDPGVTPSTIVIGQSAAFSGPAAELGNEMRAGATAYFRAINAAGGVSCASSTTATNPTARRRTPRS